MAPASMANKAGLMYADLSGPGYSRRRAGRGFSYLCTRGRRLTDANAIRYCKSLVIPPAWNDVWISPARNAHVLCTGIDQKKRKQYIYHPDWSAYQNRVKFSELLEFGKCLPDIRSRVSDDMNRKRFSKRRVVASVIRMIDSTLIRVGNDAYSKENSTYGATTLLEEHVDVSGDTVTLDFRGKSGKYKNIDIADPKLARSITYCQELPGQRLFQYQRNGTRVEPVTSSDVNAYLNDVSGKEFTAKTFRTWGGTVLAVQFATTSDIEDPKKLEVATVKHASKHLGNTVAVARKYYIHPDLLASLKQGDKPGIAKRSRKGLSRTETTLIRLLPGYPLSTCHGEAQANKTV